ncbi:PAS domain-containing sensor histidine kinase [Sphingomonas quercus]|uniref:histidine kinase n=1 Tax=Sphingomonas quercus TaxID=2842451 RepID=A0ABS6BJ75_9SPHN|nr:PAS domain-containing sensor histidine kinase [Sphingomonas quercus]MBU3078350.1 PAS-domain containing protein [Sphingomonas quercus]
MINVTPITLALISALLAIWLGVAVWATIAGLRAIARARDTESYNLRLAGLIEGGPAIPLVIHDDGRIEAPARLARRLGLTELPETLDELLHAETLVPADLEAFGRDIAAARTAGARLNRPLRLRGSDRILVARGGPAAGDLTRGGVVAWVFDVTDARREIDRLEQETNLLGRALDSLSALIEAAPVPMWHRAPDLRIDLVNTAYVRAVEGVDAEDVISRGLELIDGPAARPADAEPGTVAVRTLPATIGGERRMLRVVDVALGENGVAGYAVDIEELEEARADLDRFAEAQHQLLDQLSAGVAQFASDRGLVFYNQPFCRLFALQPEWLSDRPEFDRVLERMREVNRLPESRDFPRWKEERRRWFLTEGVAEEAWVLPGGRHLRVVPQPMPDGGLLLIFEDRTEQVKLESARDELLRVRTATFNNLFEAIGVFASDGRLQMWNDRFGDVWGLSEEELGQHPRIDALVSSVAKRLVNPSRAGLIRELVRIATVERQQRSGRVMLGDGRHFEFAAVPLPDGNALFTMIDITDSRRIEQALRERNEALEEGDRVKTAFVANMSYELRTPLTSIGGFAEMLAEGYAGPLTEQQSDYMRAILSSVARLGALIDDVLDLTQTGAGNLPLVEDMVDIATLVRQAAAQIDDAARHRRIQLVVELAEPLGTLVGDARRLRQALDHILRNAVAYTQGGGRVLLRAEGDAGEMRIIVADNGPGIPPKEKARVFDRFHRASLGVADGKQASLGLGLPLSRQFIEAHGGEVELISEEGEGTTVIISLPRRRVQRR